jgi:predicted RNA-binding protein with PUA-like domain
MWEGVRNYQARNNLRKMKKGDISFFYHSGKNPGIIGLVEVVKEHYPDPTAKEGDWSVVDIKPIRKFKRMVSLQEIKSTSALKDISLLRNSRLSVQSFLHEEYIIILELEKLG